MKQAVEVATFWDVKRVKLSYVEKTEGINAFIYRGFFCAYISCLLQRETHIIVKRILKKNYCVHLRHQCLCLILIALFGNYACFNIKNT